MGQTHVGRKGKEMNKYAKPCPFCGESIGVIEEERGDEYSYWLVIHQPHKTGQHHGRIIMPVEWWNTRPIEDALTARIAELEAERRWIPVSERLPERDGFYLVLENVNQVAGYYHWCKVFGWNTDGGRTNIQSVTHWMPLPEPPEVKE